MNSNRRYRHVNYSQEILTRNQFSTPVSHHATLTLGNSPLIFVPHNTPQHYGGSQTPSIFRTPGISAHSRAVLLTPGYNNANQRVPFTPIKLANRANPSLRQVPEMPSPKILSERSPWTPGTSQVVPQMAGDMVQKIEKNYKVSKPCHEEDHHGDRVVPNLEFSSSSSPSSSSQVEHQPPVKKRRKRYLV